ncbi:hypothetical protein B0H12DRAFT_293998 [Mycena haematopus]|nr:hypothetical protein B0H12DRAFT_293998 [Mycena haematopus]
MGFASPESLQPLLVRTKTEIPMATNSILLVAFVSFSYLASFLLPTLIFGQSGLKHSPLYFSIYFNYAYGASRIHSLADQLGPIFQETSGTL